MSADKPQNSPVTVTLTMAEEMLPKIDERAKGLDLNRSQYVRRLIREDLARAAAEQAQNTPAASPAPMAQAA